MAGLTKAELEDELAKAERKIAKLEKAAESVEPAPAGIAGIEAALASLLAEGDKGNGAYVHLLEVEKALQGFRHAETAWRHLNESPLSAGASREAVAAELDSKLRQSNQAAHDRLMKEAS